MENKNQKEELYTYEIMPEGSNQYDLTFKIIVVGDTSVGKSCLTLKALKNVFMLDSQPTVGFEFVNLVVKINKDLIGLQIWDTCGQESYKSLVTNFYRSSSLAILVYSIDNRASFENIDIWLKELRIHSSPNVKVILVGNKKDLELEGKRSVTKQDGQKYAEENKIDYFIETSAKEGETSRDIFIEAAKILHKDFALYSALRTNSRKNSEVNVRKENSNEPLQPLHPYDSNSRLPPGKKSFSLKNDAPRDRDDKGKSCSC
jgi:small GTP-binding protein